MSGSFTLVKGRLDTSMAGVKKRFLVTGSLLLIALGIWFGGHGSSPRENGISSRNPSKLSATRAADDSGDSDKFKTKAGIRDPAAPHATHHPEKLKQFILPEVAIDGLTLAEALRKLMGVYEETCRKTGEIDAATGKAVIHNRSEMTDSGFSNDGGTRFVVQTREDGSRTLLLVSGTLIDATGRPMHGTAD